MIVAMNLNVRKAINKLANSATKRTLHHPSSSRPTKVACTELNNMSQPTLGKSAPQPTL